MIATILMNFGCGFVSETKDAQHQRNKKSPMRFFLTQNQCFFVIISQSQMPAFGKYYVLNFLKVFKHL